MDCSEESCMLGWCHQLLSGFQANGHLPRVSHQSSLLDDKDDKEVESQGLVNRFPRKPQLGDHLKAVRPIIAPNRVPRHQMTSVGLHSIQWENRKLVSTNHIFSQVPYFITLLKDIWKTHTYVYLIYLSIFLFISSSSEPPYLQIIIVFYTWY